MARKHKIWLGVGIAVLVAAIVIQNLRSSREKTHEVETEEIQRRDSGKTKKKMIWRRKGRKKRKVSSVTNAAETWVSTMVAVPVAVLFSRTEA